MKRLNLMPQVFLGICLLFSLSGCGAKIPSRWQERGVSIEGKLELVTDEAFINDDQYKTEIWFEAPPNSDSGTFLVIRDQLINNGWTEEESAPSGTFEAVCKANPLRANETAFQKNGEWISLVVSQGAGSVNVNLCDKKS